MAGDPERGFTLVAGVEESRGGGAWLACQVGGISPHLTSLLNTPPYPHPSSPRLTSPHPQPSYYSYLNPLHLTSHNLTSPHLSSPHLQT